MPSNSSRPSISCPWGQDGCLAAAAWVRPSTKQALRAPGLERWVVVPLVDVILGLLCPARGWHPHRHPSSDGMHRGHLALPVHHTPSSRRCAAIIGGLQSRGALYPGIILMPHFFFPNLRSGLRRRIVSSSC